MDRPTIIVDIDQVLYPWAEQMYAWLSNRQVPRRPFDHYKSWEVWDDWGIPLGQFNWEWRQAIEAGFMYRSGAPDPRAVAAMWALSDADWHIHLATARLTKFGLHDEIVSSTTQWLKQYAVPYRDLSFTESKGMIAAEAIVDDSPLNLSGLFARSRGAYLFPARHNQGLGIIGGETMIRLGDENPWGNLLEYLT